ncbi:hypothetical protein PG994_005088 [Apiospora phragmitis]|uniref:Uncharacterized protein n=1 Tax=Apiospora phragmitis TaxID=2905665 RepID=A0ABR1VSE6_9PEZI
MVEFKNYDFDRDIQATSALALLEKSHVPLTNYFFADFPPSRFYRVVAHDVHRSRHAEPTTDSDSVYQRRYELDQRSIFIGNFPEDNEGLEREVHLLPENSLDE